MNENDMPSKPAQKSEKPFNPNRSQRRAGLKAYMKTDAKRARALAANHPPVVIDRRRKMVAMRGFALAS